VANHKSAKKRARQTIVKTIRNRAVKSQVRASVRSFREALEAGDLEAAKTNLVSATRELYRAASKGVMHKRSASRRVSRLATQFHGASAK
jgi:small subunit ribosomal protein S20